MELPRFSLKAFPNLNLSFFINTEALLIVLVLFSIVYAAISSVLIYHWYMYGMRSSGVIIAETLFLSVSLFLFVFAGLAISYF